MKALLVAALIVVSAGTAAAQSGSRALYFTGEGGYSGNFTGAGATGVDTNSTTLSGADLTNYRIVFLWVNTGLSSGSRTTLQNFYTAGGTIVGVADAAGFRDAAPAFNGLTNALGYGSMYTTSSFDSGCSKTATAQGAHPLNAGAPTIRYAYGSDLNGGDLVYLGVSMDVVRAIAKVPTDSNDQPLRDVVLERVTVAGS